jgi:hypothetical protein
MGLRLEEGMSPVTVVWGTRANPTRPFSGFVSRDDGGTLLETDLPTWDDRRADPANAVAVTALALALVQLPSTEQELAWDGNGPAGRTRRDD